MLDRIKPITVPYAEFWPSSYYHNRYECRFFGPNGRKILHWIRSQFVDDDMIYCKHGAAHDDCAALISSEQLTMTLIRWR